MAVKKIKVEVSELTCDKCGMVWQIPTTRPLPKVCYRCKSLNWNLAGKKNKRFSVDDKGIIT